MRRVLAAVAIVVAARMGGGAAGQTRRVRNESMGVLQTSTGNSVGFPSKVLLAWPRSEVHKKYGIPGRVLMAGPEGSLAEAERITPTFRTGRAVADVYDGMPGLTPHPVRLRYDTDSTTRKLGIRQRVKAVEVTPRRSLTLERLLDDSSADLPEADDLCGGSCALYGIRRGEERYLLAFPAAPTSDHAEIGRWAGAGYGSPAPERGWSPAIRLVLNAGGTHVTGIHIVALRREAEIAPGAGKEVATAGSWETRPRR